MDEERVFLEEASALVSISRVIISGTTYSTANITSVSKRIRQPKSGCAVALVVLGALFMLGGLAGFSEDFATGMAGVVFASLILGPGILWLRSLRPTYLVIFASASGEHEALGSPDEALIDRVVAAVNQAIIARG
jgi:Family of unknown function (DUF6232)